MQLSAVTLSGVMQIFEFQTDRLDALRHGFGITLQPDLTLRVAHKGAVVIVSPYHWRIAEPLQLAAPKRELERVDADGRALPPPVELAAKRRGRPPKGPK